LRSKADFAAMRKGRRISCGGIRAIYQKNTLTHSRLGMAVSRKYGNAVQRNRFKRQIRDLFRHHATEIMPVDLLIIPTTNPEQLNKPEEDFIKVVACIKKQLQAGNHAH